MKEKREPGGDSGCISPPEAEEETVDPVLSEAYERFARLEARGRSPLYDKMAQWVAGSEASQRFLLNLPQDRRQPNLLFAAMRMVHGLPESGEAFDDALYDAGDAIAHVMRTRTTQTNEPGRCATLMPLLDEIDGPIALIEVGASAGLCLLPDYYGYDWGHARLMPDKDKVSGTVPVFPCATSEATPLPETYPDIVWREGLDLNPLDVTNDDDTQWLELLVWPEHKARLASLRLAIDVARQHKPLVRRGDLRDDLVALDRRGTQGCDAGGVPHCGAELCHAGGGPAASGRFAFIAV